MTASKELKIDGSSGLYLCARNDRNDGWIIVEAQDIGGLTIENKPDCQYPKCGEPDPDQYVSIRAADIGIVSDLLLAAESVIKRWAADPRNQAL